MIHTKRVYEAEAQRKGNVFHIWGGQLGNPAKGKETLNTKI
jgi:hypothetical protein